MSLTHIDLDSSTLATLDACAKFRSLSREEMLRTAINEAADYDRYYREEVEAGLRDAASGRVISNEEMKLDMASFLQQIRNARP